VPRWELGERRLAERRLLFANNPSAPATWALRNIDGRVQGRAPGRSPTTLADLLGLCIRGFSSVPSSSWGAFSPAGCCKEEIRPSKG